ncbi:MAG TPA: SPOR domain-containing protein [Alcaligenes sp.]|nr:SPOR domain-containing protein [Alcaligenes sp.]HRL28353.1 SPOR domain-containing protein [Alcaligenes sp.]
MGLFSRNDTSSSSGRRAAASSDSQLSELRGRARRRLIGALALVLAVVVVVPMLTVDNTAPEPEQPLAMAPVGQTPVPAAVQPAQPGGLVVEEGTRPPAVVQPDLTVPGQPGASGTVEVAPQPGQASDPAAPVAPVAEPPAVEPVRVEPPKSADKPKPVEKPKPSAPPAAQNGAGKRTDDGSYALALLEGRVPDSPAPAARAPKPAAQQGSFTLQIVAYSNENDARSRRDQLVSSGVTNAYVETAQSGGKSTYRLRVGPFPTREAAQAAQARLRSLGYENSFISAK